MTDLYLKAEAQEAMDDALFAAGLIDGEGQPAEGVDLDRIGSISRVTGYDEAGEAIIKVHEGYHANVRTAFDFDGDGMGDFIVVPPETPFRVWG